MGFEELSLRKESIFITFFLRISDVVLCSPGRVQQQGALQPDLSHESVTLPSPLEVNLRDCEHAALSD